MEQTTYSPRDMEMTGETREKPMFETPRSSRFVRRRDYDTSARRNLMVNFAEAENINSPINASIPICSELDQKWQEDVYQEFDEIGTSQWKNFTIFWGLLFLARGAGLYLFYTYFPGYMLLCLTREFLLSGA